MKFSAVTFAALLAFVIPARSLETALPGDDGLTNWLYTPSEKPVTAKTYWLVIGVHGGGGNGQGAAGLARLASEFDDVIVLGPSFAHPKRSGKASKPATPPIDSFQMNGPVHETKLKSLIAKVGKSWKLHPQVIVHGFSAGAQFAHRFAFKNPLLVAGVSAHSAGTWATLEGDDQINPEAKTIPFVISCGESDTAKAWADAKFSRLEGCRVFGAALTTLGFDVQIKTWPGVSHKFTPDAYVQTKALVARIRSRSSSTSTQENIPPRP